MSITVDQLKPRAGYAFVKLDSKWMDQYGGIIIPERLRAQPGKTGRVTDYTPYPHRLTQIFDHGKLVTLDASCYNPIYEGMIGKHVVCDGGQLLSPTGRPIDTIYVVRLDQIALIADDFLSLEQTNIHYGRIPRCLRCKSDGGEDNMMLDPLGYCPRCNLNERGEHRDHRDLGPVPEELARKMNAA